MVKKLRTINYQDVLHDVAKSMVHLKRPERLLKMITRFIDKEFGLTHTSLLVLEEDKKRFIFTDSKGSRRLPVGFLKFEMDHPMVQWFQSGRKITKIKEDFLYRPVVESWLSNGKIPSSSGKLREDLGKVLKMMQDLKIELMIPGYYKGSLLGVLLLGQKYSRRCFTASEISFFQILTQDCSMAVKMSQYHQNLIRQNQELASQIKEIENLRNKEQETYYQIIRSLAEEVHAKDPYTFGHINQVERLGMMTAKEMGMDVTGKQKAILSAGLLLHDVGKVGIPDHILKKPERLNQDEWEVMKTHVEKGVQILKPLSSFKEVAEIVHCHHENFNGTGYPRGLKGGQIPIEARIVAVVDAFHAIVSTRCYDPGRPIEVAFQELRRCAGTQFDPQVVECFITAMQKDMKKRGVGFLEEALDAKAHAHVES